MLIYRDEFMKEMCCHAQMEYPKECCGILLGKQKGRKRTIGKVIPVENKADENWNRTHFFIHPLEIFRAEGLAEELGLSIIGFYHSHPDYDAVVSKTDLLSMIAGYSYLILSVRKGIFVYADSFEKIRQPDIEAREELLVKENKYADFSIPIGNIENFCQSERKSGTGRNYPTGDFGAVTEGISREQTGLI